MLFLYLSYNLSVAAFPAKLGSIKSGNQPLSAPQYSLRMMSSYFHTLSFNYYIIK